MPEHTITVRFRLLRKAVGIGFLESWEIYSHPSQSARETCVTTRPSCSTLSSPVRSGRTLRNREWEASLGMLGGLGLLWLKMVRVE